MAIRASIRNAVGAEVAIFSGAEVDTPEALAEWFALVEAFIRGLSRVDPKVSAVIECTP